MNKRKLKEQLEVINLYLTNQGIPVETYYLIVRLKLILEALLEDD